MRRVNVRAMKIPAHLSLWIFAMTPIVQPLIGEGVVSINPEDAPWMCKITIEQGFDQLNLCSGSLISDTQILTAGHCFGKDFTMSPGKVKVECDGEMLGYASFVKLPAASDWAYNSASQAFTPKPSRDVAVLTIPSSRTSRAITPMKVLQDPSLFMDGAAMKKDISCSIYGFGKDDDGGVGSLNRADLNGMMYSVQAGIFVMKSLNAPYLTTSTDHGDSGGAFICKSPVDGALVELAVTGGYHYQKREDQKDYDLFAPIWLQSLSIK